MSFLNYFCPAYFNPQPNISDYNKFYPMSRFASFLAFCRLLFGFVPISHFSQSIVTQNTWPHLHRK